VNREQHNIAEELPAGDPDATVEGLKPIRVTIVIPVFNEERCLRDNMARLHRFLLAWKPRDWEIVIANNGSTDQTLAIARALSSELPGIRTLHLDQKGRGRALKEAWLKSDAEVLTYMDADLSTDLNAFPGLVEAVSARRYDLAVGSRLLQPELTARCWKREVTSRTYNALVRALLGTGLSDAQCGFKAITRSAAQSLLPLVADNDWFFDTELLALAERQGYRICDLPVPWLERNDSHVKILSTAIKDLSGLFRLRRRFRHKSSLM